MMPVPSPLLFIHDLQGSSQEINAAFLRDLFPDLLTPELVSVPTVIYHGSRDGFLPLKIVRRLAQPVFLNLTFHAVDDDHGLYKTVHVIDWPKPLGQKPNP